MNQRFLLFVCITIFFSSCDFNYKKPTSNESDESRGYITPGKINLAGTPKITTINSESLRIIPMHGKVIRAKNPKITPYRINTTLVGSPRVFNLDPSKTKVLRPGEGKTSIPKKVILPNSGYVIQNTDTIYSPTLTACLYPKPTLAAPMRFKDAATYNIQYLDVEQGMPSSFVYSILQDKKGNLWFGTYGGGVTRYDGNFFFTFDEKKGLNNNRIRSIYEDSKGNLWFASNGGGVTKYDGNSFKTYTTKQGLSSNRVYAIMEDRNGNFWFGTNGAGVNKFDGQSFTIYNETSGLCNDQVYTIIQDKKGNFWFGTSSGEVSKFDGESFTNYNKENGLSNNGIRSMIEDDLGNIWIGSNGGGLIKYNGDSFTRYTQKDGLINNNILSLMNDKKGSIWIGTYGGGVNKFDGNKFTNFIENEGLSGNTIMSLFEDNSGKIWIGTNGGGVSRYDAESFIAFEQKQGLSDHTVRSILEDSRKDLWLGTDGGGFSMFNGKSFTTYTEKTGLSDNNIYSMILDRNENLWISTRRNGVTKFDGRNFTIYSNEQGLPNNNIRSLLEDKDGNIWFGSYGGGVFKYKDDKITIYGEKEGLKNTVIRCIFEDREGNIWFGTDGGGVSKFDGKTMSTYTKQEGLSNNIVMSIFEDQKGSIWFGTWNGGISKFDGKYFQNFTVEDGLSDNLVLSFVEDKFGKIWIGTGSGINVLSQPEGEGSSGTTYKHRKIGKSNGLKRLDVALNSVLNDSKNRIWWGMGKGFTMLDINNYSEKNELSSIQLNSIDIKQEFIDYRMIGDSIYTNSLPFGKQLEGCFDNIVPFFNYPETLDLPYNLNHLTFNFSAVDWSAPEKLEYQYMIPQLDNHWSVPSDENKAEYRNIPYGSYSFKVRAIGNEEVWSSILSYDFVINPPWWHTWSARILYVILIGLMIYGYNSWSTANYKQKQHEMELIISERIEEIKVQAKQLQELNNKLNLSNENLEKTVEARTFELEEKNQKLSEYAFTNAHELRAPVANLLGLIQLFDQDRTEEEVEQIIELLKKVAMRLDEITYEIRDRLEAEGFNIKK